MVRAVGLALEEALNDRVSFRRFLGLNLDADAPDHTTLCRFRNRMAAARLITRLFAEFNRQIEGRGLVLKQGTMVDATWVECSHTRPPPDRRPTRLIPTRALPSRKASQAPHGYKAHVGVDQRTRLIRSAILTPANVNETVVADDLIRGDEAAVYADKAYAKRERRDRLKAAGIKDRIMHKTWGGGPPLTHWQKRRNALIAIRASVETVMAGLRDEWVTRARDTSAWPKTRLTSCCWRLPTTCVAQAPSRPDSRTMSSTINNRRSTPHSPSNGRTRRWIQLIAPCQALGRNTQRFPSGDAPIAKTESLPQRWNRIMSQARLLIDKPGRETIRCSQNAIKQLSQKASFKGRSSIRSCLRAPWPTFAGAPCLAAAL